MVDLNENLIVKGAVKLARECGCVSKEDIALVVCDYQSFAVANEIAKACLSLGANTNLVVIQPTGAQEAEPPELVGAAMAKSTVVFAVTTFSMSHTLAVRVAKAAGSRVVSMPDFNPRQLISGAIEADFPARSIISHKLKEILQLADHAHLTSALGTDMTFGLTGRPGRAVDGIARCPGDFVAPPNIESSIAPLEEMTEGILVVNGSIAGVGLLREPITVTVEKGRIVSITGGEQAEELKAILEAVGDPQSYMIGELGIGLNDHAKVCGDLLEDEGVMGTVHVAPGNNSNFGGIITAKTHLDMVVSDVTLMIDDLLVIDKGQLMEDNIMQWAGPSI